MGSYEFAEYFRKNGIFCGRTEASAPTVLWRIFRRFVGADAHIGPAKRTVFTEIFRKSVIAQWVDVGIDPYESTGENTEIR